MDCPTREQIQNLLNGILPAQEAGELERHIKECDTCRALYEEFKSVDEMLRSGPVELPDDLYWKKLSRDVTTHVSEPGPAPRRVAGSRFLATISIVARAAAVAIVFLCAAILVSITTAGNHIRRQPDDAAAQHAWTIPPAKSAPAKPRPRGLSLNNQLRGIE